MNTPVEKRLISFFLAVVMALSMVSVVFAGEAPAESTEVQRAAQTESDLIAQAKTLGDKIKSLRSYGDWNGLVELTGKTDVSADKNKKEARIEGLRGRYYFLVSHNNTNLVFDGSGTIKEDGTIQALTEFTLQSSGTGQYILPGNQVTPNNAVTLVPYKNSINPHAKYAILMNNKTMLAYPATNTLAGTKYRFGTIAGNTNTVIFVYLFHNPGSSYTVIHRSIENRSPTEHLMEYWEGGKSFAWSNYFPQNNGSTYQGSPNSSHSIYLYRLWSTKELKDAIDAVNSYLSDPAAYPEGVYASFLTCLSESIAIYEKYNGYLSRNLGYGEYPDEAMGRQANALLSYVTLLGSEQEFIEIPVEILDFRADGVLFDNMGRYNLRYDYSDFQAALAGSEGYAQIAADQIPEVFRNNDLPELPGKVIVFDNSSSLINVTSHNAYRTGLTKQTLVDGKLLYDEQTIAFVAYLIYKQCYGSAYNVIINSNTDPYEKMKKGIALGSWDETFKKIGKNGGALLWSKVTTAFDMAYYLLTYLWQPAPQVDGNKLSDGYYYNLQVPERSTLRLYQDDDTNMYTMDASLSMGYADRYILNAPSAQPGMKTQPLFAPIDGLGFEAEGYLNDYDNRDTDAASGDMIRTGHDSSDSNFHFTAHAYGSFVYYEDQLQEFTFRGDDDVYFFINDQMVLDLGAGHTAASGTVRLNDIAATFGFKDGDVCTFDMFYAERATTASNLRFSTNIKIVDTSALTTKGQYLEQTGNKSFIDPSTGMGAAIIDNGLVSIGSTVGYSFDIRNGGDLPLYNVSFVDKTLGTSISPKEIKLYDPDCTNGAETAITDIGVYYRSYDPETDTLFSGNPAKLSFAEMEDMVSKAVGNHKSLEPGGYYWVSMENERQLKDLLTLGIPTNCLFSVYGFKRKTVDSDRPFSNTVTSNCYYYWAERDNMITGSASRILQVPDPSQIQPPVGERIEIVLDYGKAVKIPVQLFEDAVSADGTVYVGEFAGLVTEGYHEQLLKRLPGDQLCTTAQDGFEADQGFFSRDGENILYRPQHFLHRVETAYALVELNGCSIGTEGKTTEYKYILLELALIPATSVYYEAEDFVQTEISIKEKTAQGINQTWGQRTDDGSTGETGSTQDLGLVGDTTSIYGQDSSYKDDAYLSNSKSLFAEGAGVKLGEDTASYTEVSFAFFGTGFDLISRTGIQQATIRVEVREKASNTVKKAITVNNKGEMELYQIPVVSIQGLPYGEYAVKLWVNKALTSIYPFLTRGGEFYFDAIRIYDPVCVEKENLNAMELQALNAYRTDKEAYPYIKEVRDSLLTTAQFNQNVYTTGALFVDSNVEYTAPGFAATGENTHLAVTVQDYNKLGPKNEVYLSPGEAIAFKLELDAVQRPVSIDVGAKSILGDSAILAAGFVTSVNNTSTLKTNSRTVATLDTSTALYYGLDISTLPQGGNVYLILYNAHTGGNKAKNILSITDLKVAYDQPPTADLNEDNNIQPGTGEIHPMENTGKGTMRTGNGEVTSEPYRFMVDEMTLFAAEVFLNGFLESPEDEAPVVDSSVKIMHSLNLASDISINYVVAVDQLSVYESCYLECILPVYSGNEKTDIKDIHIEPVLNNGYYYFTLTGITAVQMGDEIEATLYMTKDGKNYISEPDLYSVATYAYAQMDKASSAASLKTLCADLLTYGATAQTFKHYRTDALCDNAMTTEQTACCSNLDGVIFGDNNYVLDDVTDPQITWAGKALNLESKVVLRFIIETGFYTGKVEDLTLRVTFNDYNGEERTVILANPASYGNGTLYAFDFDGLLAAELRNVVKAAVYTGEEQLSPTLCYSADTYGKNKTGTLGTLCKALFAYSDSAKNYFAG